jgi:hypothetical protein
VARVVTPATQEAESVRIMIPVQPEQKLSKTPISINKPGMMVYIL